jgi:hypothetical protein
MSKEYSFVKEVNLQVLEMELKEAGFVIDGIAYDRKLHTLKVRVADSEIKNPATLVSAHVKTTAPNIDWQTLYADQKDDAGRIAVLAKYLGLSPLDSSELKTGTIVVKPIAVG